MTPDHRLKLVTAPDAEPVSLALAKTHCNISISADDALVDSMIVAARRFAEKFTRRAFVTQTWDFFADNFPACDRRNRWSAIQLPKPPLVSVTHVKYVDAAGTLQTISTDVYDLQQPTDGPGQVFLKYGQSWPTSRCQANAVQIRFVAGYGTADAVPETIKKAILFMVGHWYENREGVVVGTISKEIEFAVTNLLRSERPKGYP